MSTDSLELAHLPEDLDSSAEFLRTPIQSKMICLKWIPISDTISCRQALQAQKIINTSSSLKSWISNLFPYWMVLLSMPVSIWSCTCTTVPRWLSMMGVESTLLISNISDVVQLESETGNKVLSLLILVLLVFLYSSSKLESSLSLLLLTSSSSNAEAHMAKLTPCWHSRTDLQGKMTWWGDGYGVQQQIFSVLIYYSDCYTCLVGEAMQGKCCLCLWQIPSPGQK